MKRLTPLWTGIILMLILAMPVLAAVDGAQLTIGQSSTYGFFQSATLNALGGRSTQSNAQTSTQTLAWSGIYGLVFGNITLTDNSSASIYSWPSNSTGIVLMSKNSTIDFANLSAQNDCTIEETLTGTGSDRVNLTFAPSSNSEFEIGSLTIGTNTTCTTHTYVNSAPSTVFEEIILQDNTGSTIFATKALNATSFRGTNTNYQILLPETTTSSTTTYYVYAELQ